MPDLVVCKPCAAVLRSLASAVNGGTVDMGAFALGPYRVYMAQPSPQMTRHEKCHTAQCAARAPRWLRWLPSAARAWAGTPAFLLEYRRLWQIYGYDDHPLEIEARAAEEEVT